MVASVGVAVHVIRVDVGLRVIRVGGCGWACSSDVWGWVWVWVFV